MDRYNERRGDTEDSKDASNLAQRCVLPWKECKPEDRAWQEDQVRRQGYCPCCENLNLEILNKRNDSPHFRGWPAPRLSAVRQSSERGCRCCDLLSRIVDDFHLIDGLAYCEPDTAAASSIDAADVDIVDFYFGETDSDDFILYLRVHRQSPFHGESDVIEGKQHIQVSRLRNDAALIPQLADTTLLGNKGIGASWTALPFQKREVSSGLGDPRCLQLVDEWLQECLKHHEPEVHDPVELPTRVVEIIDDQSIRIRDTKGQRGEYLTLSHHWGRDPRSQPKRTTCSNLSQHMSSIPISSLNASLRDAIELTRRLGFKFIWIDSLCIVQDDVMDWARESGGMSDVFSRSTLTIFAATPSGCFVRRQSLHRAEDGLRKRDFETNRYEYSDGGVTIIAHPVITHSRVAAPWDIDISNSPIRDEDYIFNRGWVLQEWLLSTRAIIFDQDELFWCCNDGVRCECERYVLGHSLQDTPLALRQWLRDGNPWGPETPENNRWFAIAESYSRTLLTFETDRLPALSGLAKMFATSKRIQRDQSTIQDYFAGCWKPELLQSLLWRPDMVLPRSRVGGFGREYIAPSWSWLSAYRSITFPALDQLGAQFWYLATIDGVECPLATSDRTGALTGGSLTIHAATLDYEVEIVADEIQDAAAHPHQSGIKLYRDFGTMAYTRLLDSGRRSVKARLILVCCSTQRGSRYGERGILVVQAVADSGIHERIGSFVSYPRNHRFPRLPLDQDGKFDKSLPEHVYEEYTEAFLREEEAWSKAAFGVDSPGEVDVSALEQLAKRLYSGDFDEIELGDSLLRQSHVETITII